MVCIVLLACWWGGVDIVPPGDGALLMLVWCLTVMGLAYIYQVRVACMAYTYIRLQHIC